jgi:ribosomal protein L22
MSPDTPQDPQKGQADTPTPDEATQAKEAAAVEESKPKKPRAKKPAAAKAAESKADAPVAEKKPRAKKPAAAKAGESTAAKPKAEPKTPAPAKTPARAKAPARESARPRRAGGRAAEPAVLVRAQAKYVRTSARKARLVCDHIRGKDVAEARAILAFTPRQAAKAWSKLLESAIANAENNHELVGEELRVHSVVADEGPTLKRFRPRAMGRATRIRKRTSHLTITLTPKES